MAQKRIPIEKKANVRKPDTTKTPAKRHQGGTGAEVSGLLRLQRQVGNRAVQRMLAQRSADGSFELDEDTANRINRARGGGQALDGAVQEQMSQSMGYDFSGVRVHTSPESDALNQQLSAKAFTTGQDIFFRQGAYSPHSSSGRELVGHELSHVVQQGTGQVSGGGRMTVRPAGDTYEQEADAVAKTAVGTGVQMQAEEEEVQMQPIEEEEEMMQPKALQRQEEDEEVQAKALQRQEEDEELQAKALQRQEEEEVQMKTLQRQEEEEEVQAKSIQRQEEEELQAKPLQRQDVPEEELAT